MAWVLGSRPEFFRALFLIFFKSVTYWPTLTKFRGGSVKKITLYFWQLQYSLFSLLESWKFGGKSALNKCRKQIGRASNIIWSSHSPLKENLNPRKHPFAGFCTVMATKKGKNPKNRLRKSFLSGSYKSLKFDQNFPIFPIFDKTDFWQNWQQAWLNCSLDATDTLLHISVHITKAQRWRPFIYIVSVFHRDNTTFVSCQQVFNTCPKLS